MARRCEHDPRVTQLSEKPLCYTATLGLLNEINSWSPRAVDRHFKFGENWKRMETTKKTPISISQDLLDETINALEGTAKTLEEIAEYAKDKQYQQALRRQRTILVQQARLLKEIKDASTNPQD